MEDTNKKSIGEVHKQHHDDNWPMQNWRAWGSWFSWGSPIGLGLFYALIALSTAFSIWLIHHS